MHGMGPRCGKTKLKTCTAKEQKQTAKTRTKPGQNPNPKQYGGLLGGTPVLRLHRGRAYLRRKPNRDRESLR